MKLKKLNIDSYRHLQNIRFDLTYPEGHSRFGQPLEKICIIGQSATGKTSILELIKNNISKLQTIRIINGKFLAEPFQLDFNGNLEFLYNDNSIKITTDEIYFNNQVYLFNGTGGTIEVFLNDGIKIIYLSSDIISRESVNFFNKNPLNVLNEQPSKKQRISKFKNTDTNYFYEFIQDINIEIWFSLLYEILDYRKRFTQMASEVINKGAIADVNKLSKQFSNWSEKNKNPLASFAKAFNPILKRLNLEIDLINTEYPISIKHVNKDEIIPFSSLSTGTKELLLSMFPLYKLDTSDSIILIDEPERSLFPDMQIDLISHYKTLAPKSQIIVATHSPFIAAAFEPEERFILYFNKNGEVAVRRGESPIGDNPNDILRSDFNVDYYNEFGKQAYEKYLNLKTKVAQETEPAKKKELIVEMSQLGDKYNF